MAIPIRLSAEEVHRKLKSSDAIFVCAYDSDEKYEHVRIEDSIPFSQFKSMLPTIPKTKEIIFYCA